MVPAAKAPNMPWVKSLYADAASGIIFNIKGTIKLGDTMLPEGVIALPLHSKAETISLEAGAKLAGIRFQPAVAYSLFGKHYRTPTLLEPENTKALVLDEVFQALRLFDSGTSQIDRILKWAEHNLTHTNELPKHLKKVIELINEGQAIGSLSELALLSDRQIERHFGNWLGITPKHYQRIIRVKNVIEFLRCHANAKLSDVAQQFGFSDQAHMSREFQAIARTSPSQLNCSESRN